MQYVHPESTPDNQLRPIRLEEEAEAIVVELVGDLAAYRPGAKVVFFEGSDSEFDLKMVSKLFPDLEKKANLVSGGNRHRVAALHRILEDSVHAGNIPVRIYSIVDRDSGNGENPVSSPRHHSWDVYHIENYLLQSSFILQALEHLGVDDEHVASEAQIEDRLMEISEEQIGRLVSHRIRERINRLLVDNLDLSVNVSCEDIGLEMHRAVHQSIERVTKNANTSLKTSDIQAIVDKETSALSHSLRSGDWRREFRGRDVLRAFAGKHLPGMRYEYFRDLIVGIMANQGHQPQGMRAVLDRVLDE